MATIRVQSWWFFMALLVALGVSAWFWHHRRWRIFILLGSSALSGVAFSATMLLTVVVTWNFWD